MQSNPSGNEQSRSQWQQMRMPSDRQRPQRGQGPKRTNPLLRESVQQQHGKSPIDIAQPQQVQQQTPLLDSAPKSHQGVSALYKHNYPQQSQGQTPYFQNPNEKVVRPSPLLNTSQHYQKTPRSSSHQQKLLEPRSGGGGYQNYTKHTTGGYGRGSYGSIQHIDPFNGVPSDDEDEGKHRTLKNRTYSKRLNESELKQAFNEGTLKEQADCRLETMTRVPTSLVLLAPYICFAFALWLDTNWGLQESTLALSGVKCGTDSCVVQSSAGDTWTGTISGVPPASTFLYFDANFPNNEDLLAATTYVSSADGKDLYSLPYSIKVTANGHEGNTISLYNEEGAAQFWCKNGQDSCEAERLLRLVLNSVGESGWYSDYQISLTYEESLADLIEGTKFSVMYSSSLFTLICKYTRTAMLLVVFATILNWLIQNGLEKESVKIWIPDRQYFTVLLFSLFMWANPVLSYVEWTEGNVPHLQSFLLSSDLLHSVGTQGLLLSALLLMDGLRIVKKKKKTVVTYQEALSQKEDLPYHHPCSDYACDFFWIKVIYFVFSTGVSIACALSRHSDVLLKVSKAHISSSSLDVDYISGFYLGLSFLLLLFNGGWILWILKASIRTGFVLKRQPFLKNRFQQLIYRILFAQYTLIMICLCVSYGWEIFNAVKDTIQNFNLELLSQVWAGQSSLEVLWSSTPGQLIFMVASFVTIQYIMLPPYHYVRRANNRMYIAMERDLPPTYLMQKKRPVFCLETALYLMEVSWQVYYECETYGTNPMAVGKANLAGLGLQLEALFQDDEHDIRGFLARTENRLILAFRGTMTLKNVLTDLNLGQVLLYDFMDPPESGHSFEWSATSSDSDIESPINASQKKRKKRGKGGCTQYCRRVANAIPCLRSTVPRIHEGFAKSYKKIRNHVLKAVQAAQNKKYAPLYITGHSLGACIGALAAYDIATQANSPDNIVLYSFGMPRLGNARFAKMFNKKVPHHFRVTVDGDAIPGQPHFFYKHCGTRVLVDADYAGSIIVHPSIVEKTFGTRGHTNISSHSLSKYRDCLEACLEKEEYQEYLSKGMTSSKGKADPDAVPDWLKQQFKPTDEGCIIS